MDTKRYKVIYLRQGSQPIACVATTIINNQINYGIACSTKLIDKKSLRQLALGRLIDCPKLIGLPYDNEFPITTHDITYRVFLDIRDNFKTPQAVNKAVKNWLALADNVTTYYCQDGNKTIEWVNRDSDQTLLHSLNGPAKLTYSADGILIERMYAINGVELTREQFIQITKVLKDTI
jgi:hypothetical protein